ncbi:zinc ribbon domain-containing protein [Methanococcoides sp.]|uniref:zinc ribbon domain-containing protein n=1 Tax=Methanococcoides sp. TaxID=1966350 RepID=UPI00272DD1EC|nr:zinc ribbon domain-containing protein [Methanococcoides sp.]
MDMKEFEGMVFCQSCGMPLEKDEDFGANADGTKSDEYCLYCYQNGKFTQPDITLEEMIEQTSKAIDKEGVDLQTPICDGNVPCEINQVNLITNLTEEDCPDFTGICHSIKL